jgi:hypothetical protein
MAAKPPRASPEEEFAEFAEYARLIPFHEGAGNANNLQDYLDGTVPPSQLCGSTSSSSARSQGVRQGPALRVSARIKATTTPAKPGASSSRRATPPSTSIANGFMTMSMRRRWGCCTTPQHRARRRRSTRGSASEVTWRGRTSPPGLPRSPARVTSSSTSWPAGFHPTTNALVMVSGGLQSSGWPIQPVRVCVESK